MRIFASMFLGRILKPLGAFLLIAALLFQTFPQSLLALDYQLHTDMYAAYCINKDKPEMQCNGLCQLDKKLDELDHHHHDSNTQKEPVVSVYMIPEIVMVEEALTFHNGSRHQFYQTNRIIEQLVFKIPHPPQSILV